ncbi:MAG: TRAP transporter small permease [Dehalococcoidia bacterium]|jgi:TRAP-type C4-dicarboxylate transport system permease small subunit
MFNKFEKAVTGIAGWLNWVACASLALMVTLVLVDICGNKFFKVPLPGGIELVSLLSVAAIAFAIAQTQVTHGHIEVEMLVRKLPRTAQKVIAAFVHCLGICLFVILAWQSYTYGLSLQSSGEVSMTLRIPYYPFIWALGLCSLAVVLVLIMQMIKMLRNMK